MKYEDLKCELCDGAGEKSRDSDGRAVEHQCSYCNGTGIDQDQLHKAFVETFATQEPCAACGCSLQSHGEDLRCPEWCAGNQIGWLDTKFLIR